MTDTSEQPTTDPLTSAQDKNWATWSHIGGVIGFLPSLIIYLVFKDRGARTRVEAREALNWQITFTGIHIALVIGTTVVSGILLPTPAWMLSGLVGLLPLLWWTFNIVLSIIGGVKVNAGGSYRYPINFRFIK